MSFSRKILNGLLVAFFRVKLRYRVHGLENVPRTGALLVVANHLSNTDPPLLSASFKRKVTFMGKEELFRQPLIGYCLRKLGGFPVRRGKIDLKAMRRAYRELAAGGVLVMFPEGKRSKSGGLGVGYRGAAQIAVHAGVPVLPVAISGTEVLDRFRGWFKRPRVVINIGQPFYLTGDDDVVSREELDRFTGRIMTGIAGLLPAAYRGQYGG